MGTKSWDERLRGAGLRVTAPRVAAVRYVADHPHSSADQIYHGSVRSGATLTLRAMHGVVTDLARAGVLRRIELTGNDSALYELQTNDNHHHMICVGCGRIEDVACDTQEPPCMLPDNTFGMTIIEAQLIFQAICADCLNQDGIHNK